MEKESSKETSKLIPKQVWLAAGLAVVGAVVIAVVAIVNTPLGNTPLSWGVGAPCISIAVMLAVVCYAIVRYR